MTNLLGLALAIAGGIALGRAIPPRAVWVALGFIWALCLIVALVAGLVALLVACWAFATWFDVTVNWPIVIAAGLVALCGAVRHRWEVRR